MLKVLGGKSAEKVEERSLAVWVTLALCLVGAVMVYRASAVTADQQYGRSVYFFAAAGGVAGDWDFRDVCADADGLPAACASRAVVYTVVVRGAVDAAGGVFSGQVARHASVDQIWTGGNSAVGVGKAGGDFVSGVVSGFEARGGGARWNSAKKIFCRRFCRRLRPILVFVALILAQPDLGTAVDIVVIATAVLFVAGLSWKWLACGVVGALPILYLLITHVWLSAGAD